MSGQTQTICLLLIIGVCFGAVCVMGTINIRRFIRQLRGRDVRVELRYHGKPPLPQRRPAWTEEEIERVVNEIRNMPEYRP